MNTNPAELLTLSEVAAYFMISESSVRRKVRLAREQQGLFPLPIFSKGSKLRWKRSDILEWDGENTEFTFTPSLPLSSHQAVQTKDQAQTHRELRRKHGIDLSQSSDKNNC
jgi:predicted DNA-binding transcriptional regulator AlpA